jgi:hypothetical protein
MAGKVAFVSFFGTACPGLDRRSFGLIHTTAFEYYEMEKTKELFPQGCSQKKTRDFLPLFSPFVFSCFTDFLLLIYSIGEFPLLFLVVIRLRLQNDVLLLKKMHK